MQHVAQHGQRARDRQQRVGPQRPEVVARYEHEARNIGLVALSESEGHDRAPGMTDHNRALDAELAQGVVEQFGLLGGGPEVPARALAVTEAGPIEDDHPMAPQQDSATPLVFQSSPLTALPWISTTGLPSPRSL